jgi:hypothetical protein
MKNQVTTKNMTLFDAKQRVLRIFDEVKNLIPENLEADLPSTDLIIDVPEWHFMNIKYGN